MKLITKKGSALEQTVKEMCDKMTKGTTGALDLVEKATGIRPANMYHIFHWGTISKLVPEFVIKGDDVARINPKQLRRKKGERDVWVPAARYKEGKQLKADFRKWANEYIVDDKPLQAFGINTVNWKAGVSYRCELGHDTESDRYILVCSNSIPEGFDKKKLAKDQFEIEY